MEQNLLLLLWVFLLCGTWLMCVDLGSVLTEMKSLYEHFHLSHDRDAVYYNLFEKNNLTATESSQETLTGTGPERSEEQRQEAVERTMHYHKLQCYEILAGLAYSIPSLLRNCVLNLITIFFIRHIA